MKQKPLVSVVIPTLNSANTIKLTLNSIREQTYKNIEIIVSDGKSKDNTVEIAKSYGARICFGKELGIARYEGMKISKGRYLFALDSDQIIEKTVISRATTMMVQKNFDALIINERSIVRKGTIIEKLLSYDKWVVVSSNDSNPLFGAEIPRFFNREKLLDLKWPKSVSILDDAILYYDNLNYLKNVSRLGGEGISHYEVDSFRVFFRKFMRYGKEYSKTLKTSGKTTVAHSFPRRNYFSLRVIKKPNVFLGVILLYLLKAIAVFCGIISYKFSRTR